MTRPAKLSLVAALLVVLATLIGVSVRHAVSKAPFRPEAAGLTGEVWVMPGTSVRGFLREHDAPAPRSRLDKQLVVVGWVAWTARPSPRHERFTVLLGDEQGRAGVIREVLGRPGGRASLNNGSMWHDTTRAHSWLRGDGPIRTEGGGWTERGMFASLPTSEEGFVWFVGQVVDPPTGQGGLLEAAGSPSPVIGVALSTGDRVWWAKKVASA